MKIFNHIQIKVPDLATTRRFYDTVMSVLGYPMVLHIEDTVIGYGTHVHDMFEISKAKTATCVSQSVHVAFNAPTKEAVDTFYRVALAYGATCNGKPDFRPEYENGYYAAFIIDPNGHNIEAVFVSPPKH